MSYRVQYFHRDSDPLLAEYATRDELFDAIASAFAHGSADVAYVVDAVGKAIERWEPRVMPKLVWMEEP